MALNDLLVNVVTLKKFGDPNNVGGKNVPGETLITGVRSSVQESSSAPTFGQDKVGATTSGKAFFASDPGLRTKDQILWSGRTLTVLAPANNAAGRGVLWEIRWTETR